MYSSLKFSTWTNKGWHKWHTLTLLRKKKKQSKEEDYLKKGSTTVHCTSYINFSGWPWCDAMRKLQRLLLTRALKGFFLRFKPAFWWTSINRYHGFSRVGLEKILSPFPEKSEEYVGVSAVFAIFCYRISHRFMSRLRGEQICWVFLGGNSNYRHIYTLQVTTT